MSTDVAASAAPPGPAVESPTFAFGCPVLFVAPFAAVGLIERAAGVPSPPGSAPAG
jgi:hypothetical protein